MRSPLAWLSAAAVAGLILLAAPAAAVDLPVDAPGCRSIPVTADIPLHSAQARAEFGVDGTGVSVGIISDSFDTSGGTPDWQDDVRSGVLPGPGNPCGRETPVQVLIDDQVNTDEGRAMAQVVHGIAPGAALLFASAGSSDADYVVAIDTLVAAGADIIVDDVPDASGVVYQRGPVGVAVQSAVDAGVLYVAAAGNDQVQGAAGYPSAGYPIGAWETDAYRPIACPAEVVAAVAAADASQIDCLDFDPGAGEDPLMGFTKAASDAVVLPRLAWGEPVGGVTTTLQYVPVFEGTGYPPETALDPQVPYIEVETAPSTEEQYFAIVRRRDLGDAGTPPVRWVLQQTNGTVSIAALEHYRSEGDDTVGATLWAHESDPATLAVAAADVDTLTLETFSDLGATSFLFGPVTADGVPAGPWDPPSITPGPALAGVERLAISFELVPGLRGIFPGTSCAGPTVAAVAALGRQAAGGDPSPATLRAALTASADPDGVASPYPSDIDPARARGAGLVDAYALVAAVTPAKPAAVLPVTGSDSHATLLPGVMAASSLLLGAVLVRCGTRRRSGA